MLFFQSLHKSCDFQLYRVNNYKQSLFISMGKRNRLLVNYNQGQNSLDHRDRSLFSFIHPFTALTLIFCLFSDGIVTPNSCIQMQSPLPTPCSMLRSIVESVPVRYGSTLKCGTRKITGNYASVVQHFWP